MILYSDPTGPLLEYENGLLLVEDLNPHVRTRWRMSRWEVLLTGIKFIIAAAGRG